MLAPIAALYADNLAALGPTSRAVGWKTQECQNLRFERLSTLFGGQSPTSLNDYGCGYGALLDYLPAPPADYHGYDISPEMLAAARARHPGADFRLGSEVTTVADYTLASGPFNVRFEASEEDWREFIMARLDEIDRHSRRGFAFNLLTTHVEWRANELYYGDPTFWFEHCRSRYSRYVCLLHDYPLYEWTMVVRK